MKRSATAVILGLLAVTVAACGGAIQPSGSPAASGSTSPAVSTTQRSEAGDVTAVATWQGPAAGAAFDLALDTHSVNLDALDLSSSTLRNDRGDVLTARSWAAPKGGHHREGMLTFDGDDRSFFAGATWMELVLPGIGGAAQQTLRWALGS